MTSVLYAYGMTFTLLFILWYPGFILARNMVKAVSQRKPTVAENFTACIPILNIAVARTQLYGSANIVHIPFVLTILTTIVRYILYYAFPTAITANLISLLITWIIYIYTWLILGYVLWDMCICIQAGILTKLLCFVMPPLAEWGIGRDCVALMAKAYIDLAKKEKDIGDSN